MGDQRMTQPFRLSHLDSDQVRQAYALVRIGAPETTLEQWQAYAESLGGSGGGVLGVFAGDNTIHGVATYLPETSLRHGRILRIDNFVTFELSHAAPARQALCEGLNLLAKGLGCDAVTLTLSGRSYSEATCPKCDGWIALGLEPDGMTFARKVGEAQSPQKPRQRQRAHATA